MSIDTVPRARARGTVLSGRTVALAARRPGVLPLVALVVAGLVAAASACGSGAPSPAGPNVGGSPLPPLSVRGAGFDAERLNAGFTFPPLTDVPVVGAARADWLQPDSLVLGATREGEARAYPLFIMQFHHVANDRLGGAPLLVTFCIVCSSGVAFDPTVDGRRLTLRASGLYNGVFTMVDDQTGSVWSHLDGRAIAGPLEGTALTVSALQTTTWGAWIAEHPESTTPALHATALAWLGGYEQATGRPFVDRMRIGGDLLTDAFRRTLPAPDPRLPESAVVVGVLVADEARAFPTQRRPDDRPFEDTLTGVPVVLLEDAAGAPVLAYHRTLTDGRVLSFVRRDRGVYDEQTGSRWTADGVAVAGPLAGVRLSFATSFVSEWYGWAAFHPTTSIFGEPDP